MIDWNKLAQTATDEDLKEAILAGYKGGKPFTYNVPYIPWPMRVKRVMDFGTGLGRNLSMLTAMSEKVIAYDVPAMVARGQAIHKDEAWAKQVMWIDDLRQSPPVDLIFMSLVLQHIAYAETDMTWNQLPNHTFLHVIGRARHDEGSPNTFKRIPRSLYSYRYAINPLMTVRSIPLDELTSDDTDTHYEALYRRS